jgi:hypothetical protein
MGKMGNCPLVFLPLVFEDEEGPVSFQLNSDNAVEFDEIKPIKYHHVRLTITGWPKDLPCGVLEFTVFGKPTPP